MVFFRNSGSKDVWKSRRYQVLKSNDKIHDTDPPVKNLHKENWMKWVNEYIKIDFSAVIFTNKCYTTLNGPDRWSKGWIAIGRNHFTSRDVNKVYMTMFRGGIIACKVVSLWQTPDKDDCSDIHWPFEGTFRSMVQDINFQKNDFMHNNIP